MPLQKQDDYLPKVGLQGWKEGEIRTFKFLNNGKDHNGEEYGLAYIYTVEYEGEKMNLWVRPKSPLAIGLQQIVNKHDSLENLTIEIEKTSVGSKQKDVRYVCTVV